jgi:hypothetical protein
MLLLLLLLLSSAAAQQPAPVECAQVQPGGLLTCTEGRL